jgi:hypothetical protein
MGPTPSTGPTNTPVPTGFRVIKEALGLDGRGIAMVSPGSEFLYSIRVDNAVAIAVPVQLTDTFPTQVRPVAIVSVQNGSCLPLSGQTLTCTMTPSSTRISTVVVRVRVVASTGATISNQATATLSTGQSTTGSARVVTVGTGNPTAVPTTPTRVPTTPPSTPQPTAHPVTPQPTARPVTPQPTSPGNPQPTTPPSTPQPTSPGNPQPTAVPSLTPAPNVSPAPTAKPTAKPVVKPTAKPVVKPTAKPGAKPTAKPAAKPTAKPAAKPTTKPAAKPTTAPAGGRNPQPTATAGRSQTQQRGPTATAAPTATPGPTLPPVTTPEPGKPSIRFNLKSDWGQVFVGDTFEYVVTLQNVGKEAGGSSPLMSSGGRNKVEAMRNIQPLQNVVIGDDINPAFEVLEASGTGLTVKTNGQKVEATRATLAGGEEVKLRIKVRARSRDVLPVTISNQATLLYTGLSHNVFSNIVDIVVAAKNAPTATVAPTDVPTVAPTDAPKAAGAVPGDVPPAAKPEELGKDLPQTSGGVPLFGFVLLGLTLLIHSLRAHRSRVRI